MSEEEKEFKADHFENIEELVKTCKMWVTDDDYDAYCRFFDMGAMEEILNLISTLQKELYKKDKVIDLMAEKLVEDSDVFNYQHSMTEEKWKQYFYKKASEENE